MKKLTFRKKIFAVSLVILILIGSLGSVAYYQFSEIVTQVSLATESDSRIVLVKEILNDLSSAENKVKSYTLTKDESYIVQFDSVALNVEDKIVTLYSKPNNTSSDVGKMDTMINLVNHKFEILTTLLQMQNEFRVQDAIGEIEKKMVEASFDISKVEEPKQESKKFNFFKKKDKNSETSTKDESQNVISDLKKDLKTVTKQETTKEKQLLKNELELIEEDRIVTDKIRGLLQLFEKEHKKQILERSDLVKSKVQQTKILVGVVSLFITLFVLIMIYMIVRYLRTNNRYLKMIRKAQKESEELTKSKERFIATISHELRTPMNSIVGFTEQIEQGPLTKLQKSQIEIVRKASDHLLHLIDEFLDYSRLQENKLSLSNNPFRPDDVIQEVIELSRSLAMNKNIDLISDLDDNTSMILNGDPFRLKQILLNIIGNAIKFTNEGEVRISANVITQSESESTLQIKISDTGIGIELEKLDSIFNVFEQESSSTGSKFGGSGLGLAITKKLVDLHGGRIAVESTKNVGTTFTITINYSNGEFLHLNEGVENDISIDTFKNLKVLVVDDEKYNRDLLKAILKKRLIEIHELEDGRDVATILQEKKFDLILMDVKMPFVSGIEAAQQVREIESEISATPIILLTAAVTEEDRIEYLESGVNMVLPKPYTESLLIEAIFNVLGKSDVKIESKKLDFSEGVNFDSLRQTCGEDLSFYREMLSTLIDSIMKAQSELLNCLNNSDYKSMGEIAHRICAPVKHIRANRLYALLKELEINCRSSKNLLDSEEILNKINKEAVEVVKEIRKELSEIKNTDE